MRKDAADHRQKSGGSSGSGRLRVGVLSKGIWKDRQVVETLLDAEAVRIGRASRTHLDLVTGWGHKPTAEAARALAKKRRIPYVALEDGFLRSIRPGAGEAALGWIVDRSGIYYDASGPSDLEAAIAYRTATDDAQDRARAAMKRLAELRLSKYNHAPMIPPARLGLPAGRDFVVVVDQTFGDASISGAGASPETFVAMLDAAVSENPGRTVAVKVHPEAISGAKRGHLVEAARRRRATLVDADVNPWSLIENAAAIYAVSSQFGLEAISAGVPVVAFGAACYAGWGLTDDRFPAVERRRARPNREALFAATHLDYCRWLDPWFGDEIDLETAIDQLAFLRDRFHDNRRSVCVDMSKWKRTVLTSYLDGVGGKPVFVRGVEAATEVAERTGARVVVWGSQETSSSDAGAPAAHAVTRVEDGFLRSVGLGAAFVSPASLVFDDEGIYYDPRTPSSFERTARETVFDEPLLARAETLRRTIVARRLSKYNQGPDHRLDLPTDRPVVLVPGQVEDDASVRFGSPVVRTNADLLRHVRERWPDAHVLYKPHPDVHAGYRRGAVPREVSDRLADRVITDVSMPSLLSMVDRVETMTSLTGFEALLRGLEVATHGLPFYAGWGLTDDALRSDRRDRVLTLDQLTAVALILYPRYVDPDTGLPCTVETIVRRLSERRAVAPSPTARIEASLRHGIALASHRVLFPIGRLLGLRRR